MPETQEIVINTSPIIALVAGLGGLSILQIYEEVWVPFGVCEELSAGHAGRVAIAYDTRRAARAPNPGMQELIDADCSGA